MIQALLKSLPLLRPEYAAKLVGVNGFTGRGSIGYSPSKTGARKLSIQLHGLAGREAELIIDNVSLDPLLLAVTEKKLVQMNNSFGPA